MALRLDSACFERARHNHWTYRTHGLERKSSIEMLSASSRCRLLCQVLMGFTQGSNHRRVPLALMGKLSFKLWMKNDPASNDNYAHD